MTTGGSALLTMLNSEFDTANPELIETVQKTIAPEEYGGEGYGLAPIGHLVLVRSAEGVQINIKVKIAFAFGYDWAKLKSSIKNVITGYLSEFRREWADTSTLIIRIS